MHEELVIICNNNTSPDPLQEEHFESELPGSALDPLQRSHATLVRADISLFIPFTASMKDRLRVYCNKITQEAV